jgi:hypothetical protein
VARVNSAVETSNRGNSAHPLSPEITPPNLHMLGANLECTGQRSKRGAVQANLGEPKMAIASVERARQLAGDPGLLEEDVSQWSDLVTAAAAQDATFSYRLNVTESKG